MIETKEFASGSVPEGAEVEVVPQADDVGPCPVAELVDAGELILNLSLKGIYQRQRPEAFFGYDLPPSYSFPSGHALGSFCFFGILAWIWAANVKSTMGKVEIYVTASLLILFIGLSRIYLGVHYPSDIVAGYLVAIAWTFTVIFADRSLVKHRESVTATG